jgi:hypothetical protein
MNPIITIATLFAIGAPVSLLILLALESEIPFKRFMIAAKVLTLVSFLSIVSIVLQPANPNQAELAERFREVNREYKATVRNTRDFEAIKLAHSKKRESIKSIWVWWNRGNPINQLTVVRQEVVNYSQWRSCVREAHIEELRRLRINPNDTMASNERKGKVMVANEEWEDSMRRRYGPNPEPVINTKCKAV